MNFTPKAVSLRHRILLLDTASKQGLVDETYTHKEQHSDEYKSNSATLKPLSHEPGPNLSSLSKSTDQDRGHISGRGFIGFFDSG